MEAAAHIQVFLFSNSTSFLAICLHLFFGHHRIKSSKISPFYQWLDPSHSSFLSVTLRFRETEDSFVASCST